MCLYILYYFLPINVGCLTLYTYHEGWGANRCLPCASQKFSHVSNSFTYNSLFLIDMKKMWKEKNHFILICTCHYFYLFVVVICMFLYFLFHFLSFKIDVDLPISVRGVNCSARDSITYKIMCVSCDHVIEMKYNLACVFFLGWENE